MDLVIELFGITREIIGTPRLEYKSDTQLNVAELLDKLKEEYPSLQKLRLLMVAVNTDYATPEQILNSNDKIALIPPVSGG